jgi:hypothetical protein
MSLGWWFLMTRCPTAGDLHPLTDILCTVAAGADNHCHRVKTQLQIINIIIIIIIIIIISPYFFSVGLVETDCMHIQGVPVILVLGM